MTVWLPPGERTPAGGVGYQALWFDADGEPLPGPDGAASAEIHELDEEGRSIWRTYGVVGEEAVPPPA